MESLLNIGIQQGIKKGLERVATDTAEKNQKITRIESILNLMDSMQWSAQQAMNALKIPPDEQSQYFPLI